MKGGIVRKIECMFEKMLGKGTKTRYYEYTTLMKEVSMCQIVVLH